MAKKHWSTVGDQALLHYNALDCIATARIYQCMKAEEEWESARVQKLYETHIKMSHIAAEMHETGILVDQERRQKLADDMLADYETKAKTFVEAVQIPEFRCNPNDLRSLIYARHESPKIKRFSLPDPMHKGMWSKSLDKPKISVKEDALLLLIVDPNCPAELVTLIDLYWEAATVHKARGTFVTSDLIDQAIYADGRLHPNWNSCGTGTMRWSSKEPNMQNVPLYLRAMYRVAPGHTWVHADKSQLELRVMAAVSGDEVLVNALQSGDVYAFEARNYFPQLAGKDLKDIKKNFGSYRQAAKVVRLACQYGAGTPVVYKNALKTDRTLKYNMISAVHKAWKRLYCQTVAYWFAEHEKVRELGYSEGRVLFGREVYASEPDLAKVANYPIQRTAGEIMNIEMIDAFEKAKKYVPSAKMNEQLHDAIGFQVPDRHVGVVKRIIEDQNAYQYEINNKKHSFKWEIKTGTYWNELG